jgi:butyrate kinase
MKGDRKAVLVWQGMIYQIGKMIGEMAAVLHGDVDGILLTGGYMRFPDVIKGIQDMCGWIAEITVYPGEKEQAALAAAVFEALEGKRPIHHYEGKPVWTGFEGLDL